MKEKIYNREGEFVGEREIGTSFMVCTGKNYEEMKKYLHSGLKSPDFTFYIYNSSLIIN